MKLELKHLCAYLPYGLEMLSEDKIHVLTVATFSYRLHDSMPILRPLSDFSGKRMARDVMQELNCSIKIVQELWDFGRGDKLLEEISYGLFVLMCEDHIDFNKLIEKGLAIDINTIDK